MRVINPISRSEGESGFRTFQTSAGGENMSREVMCPQCGGTGEVRCWSCKGEGGSWGVSGGEDVWNTCSLCWGKGVIRCVNCNGWGKITVD